MLKKKILEGEGKEEGGGGTKRRGGRKDFLNTSKLRKNILVPMKQLFVQHVSYYTPCHKVIRIFLGHFTVMTVTALKV